MPKLNEIMEEMTNIFDCETLKRENTLPPQGIEETYAEWSIDFSCCSSTRVYGGLVIVCQLMCILIGPSGIYFQAFVSSLMVD